MNKLVWSEGVQGAALAETRRSDLRRALEAGRLPVLDFEAVVFRAGPNRNFLKIRDEDLPAFAASFEGAPFLRDHAVESIEARAGTVISSRLEGRAVRQTIRLTTQRDIRAFVEGQMDRFSVSWFYDEALCSVCGREWGECGHKPGRRYGAGRDAAGRVRCEIEFTNPRGREVSAVNAPAVEGTGIVGEGAPAHEETAAPGAATIQNVFTNCPSVHKEEVVSEVNQWVETLRAETVGAMLARSGLSSAGMDAVRASVAALEESLQAVGAGAGGDSAAGSAAVTPAHVQRLIEAQQQAEQAQHAQPARPAVRNVHPVVGQMRTAHDEVQDAFAWLAGDKRIPTPAPHLRSLRDLYLATTGDINFWGVFDPARAQLASATSSTLAGMAVNALNKAVGLHYENMVTYRWYEQIVAVIPHDGSTQPLSLIQMDGLAALPAVNEGAAYTEAAAGDSKESAPFTKYGSYVGITLEMIRRSDIGRIQAIPRLLVQAAIRRRSAAVAAIFTSPPTLADDSTALFHADHGNTATAAFDAAGWEAARTRLFAQTVPGTAKPLGLWPAFCLLPIDLYDTALTLFGYGGGDVGKPNAAGTAQEPNVYGLSRPGDPRPIPVVVPEWTDATDWAYIVDPRLHPVIVMAYANAPAGGAHPLPELFEVRSETAGLMFSNDVLPVKARDWWACGVATHVGIGKNVVA